MGNISKIWKALLRSSRQTKRILQVLFDVFLIFFAFSTAFLLGLQHLNFLFSTDFYLIFLVVSAVTIRVLATNGLYRAFLKYLSSDIIKAVCFGTLASVIGLIVMRYLFLPTVPWTIPFIYGPVFSSLLLSSRLVLRSLCRPNNTTTIKKVAIYGAGAAGSQLIQSLRENANYTPSVIIDDDKNLQGSTMYGITIKSFDDGMEETKKQGISLVLLAIPSAPFYVRKKILNKLSVLGIEMKTIPSVEELVLGKHNIANLRNIDINDLLGRNPVIPISSLMSKNIFGKTVLVTGAGGSIGSQLCQNIIECKPKTLILLDISELAIYTAIKDIEQEAKGLSVMLLPLIGSVNDRPFISNIFAQHKIDTIYQAAAYKHVPLMEQNMLQALKNNTLGTFVIAEEAVRAKISSFTLISTDKAVNPTNIMGASKRLAERICQSMNSDQTSTRFSIVRFGNVLGSSGSVVPLFRSQIEAGGPITLTHNDVIRYFMTISEAAQLVIQASSISEGGDVFVLDMGDPVKIKDLAFKMVQLSGLQPYMEAEFSESRGDIEIRVTGLRRGEKMYEELSYGDNLKSTTHPRIMRVDETAMPPKAMRLLIFEMEKLITAQDKEAILKRLAEHANYSTSNVGGT